MSATVDLLNLGKEFEFEGLRYALKEVTLEDEGRFSAWLEGEALQCVQRLKNRLSPEDYRDMLDSIPRDSLAGVYDFGGRLCMTSLASPSGAKRLLLLLLTPLGHDTPVTEELVDRLFAAKMQEVMSMMGSGDPKARAAIRKLRRQARRLSRSSRRSATSPSTSDPGKSEG